MLQPDIGIQPKELVVVESMHHVHTVHDAAHIYNSVPRIYARFHARAAAHDRSHYCPAVGLEWTPRLCRRRLPPQNLGNRACSMEPTYLGQGSNMCERTRWHTDIARESRRVWLRGRFLLVTVNRARATRQPPRARARAEHAPVDDTDRTHWCDASVQNGCDGRGHSLDTRKACSLPVLVGAAPVWAILQPKNYYRYIEKVMTKHTQLRSGR
jgi:hypothetical protein